MFKTLYLPLLFILSLQSSNVVAEGALDQVANHLGWSVFVADSPKDCFVTSGPKKTVNKRDNVVVSVNRGKILLYVVYRPKDKNEGTVTFTGGYLFAKGRNVTIKINAATYEIGTNGEWAFPPNEDADKKIIAAMKSGSEAVVTALSERGTVTKDTFSLLGFTAALKDAKKRCSS